LTLKRENVGLIFKPLIEERSRLEKMQKTLDHEYLSKPSIPVKES